MHDDPAPTLSAAQAAARLGIRTESVYAYVSRGLLDRRRTAHGSRFDAMEVERFARTRRRTTPPPVGPAPPAGSDGRPLGVIDTDISLIEDGSLWFRGRESGELAGTHTYDAVVDWLLTRDEDRLDHPRPLLSSPGSAALAAATVAALPHDAPASSRLLVAVATLAALDPLRFDLGDAVASTARRLIAGLVDALPLVGEDPPSGEPIARRLWPRLTAAEPTPDAVRALDTALILLVDHDMAVSTVAARAAASARAHLYAVVAAGLGALDSAAHGAVSAPVHVMIVEAASDGAERAVAAWSRRSPTGVPGFGQFLYPDGDPRAGALMDAVRRAAAHDADARGVVETADEIARLVFSRTNTRASVDFALGTMSAAFGMAADGGEIVFAVGRASGWCCHAMAEYAMPPLRLRPVGRYVGPFPGIAQPPPRARG